MKKKSLGLAVALTVLIAFTLSLAACANKAKTYKVSFMNGSELHSVQQVESGKKATAPTDPTKISAQYSYAFIGWFESESAETPFDFENSTITADLTLYARYTATDILIKFTLSDDEASYAVTGTKSTEFTSIVIPDTYEGKPVTSIGINAFVNSSITSLVVGNNVTEIDDYAFSFCMDLTDIKISRSVTSIGSLVFNGSGNVTSITVDSENAKYKSVDNCLIETDTKKLIFGCNNSIIPDDESVTSIGDNAFILCKGLDSITIGKNIKSIGYYAFYGCGGLTSITVSSENPNYKSIGNCLIETATKTLIRGSNNSVIPDDESVTSIGYAAFGDCDKLSSISIGDNITTIDDSVFSGCTSLTSITIPKSVTSIGLAVFSGCSGITSVSVDTANTKFKSVDNCLIETAQRKLIFGCNNSTIPEDGSVVIIDHNAFSGSSLKSIVIPDSIGSINAYAFSDCELLESVTIGSGVTYIDARAFAYSQNLKSITVSKDNKRFKSVGNCIIETESNSLVIGCNISEIPNDGSVTSIDIYAFAYCDKITSIVIPESIAIIGYNAFRDCESLTSITIGSGVTSIEEHALMGCPISTINYNGTIEQWNAIEKENDWDLNTGNYTIICKDGKIDKQV